MKPRNHILQFLLATLLPVTAFGPLPLHATPPPAQNARPEIRPSDFVIPGSPSEGRDPFFPASTRVYASDPVNKTHGPALADLTLKSILGTPPHVFAIINNHTFASGDDEDVTTKSGERLHIYCMDINAAAGTATVEANSVTEVLHLSEGL